jgi:hypothetical protein
MRIKFLDQTGGPGHFNRRVTTVFIWVLILLCVALVVILPTSHLADAWQTDAHRICKDMSVPYEIVQAIVRVESEGHPYVLNVAIRSVWKVYRFDHAETAQVFLREALKLTDRIDIGLMQVHWAVWKRHYPIEPAALLEVSTNLTIGCDILRRELAGDGPLWMRIGRYHSRTPALNQRYASQVLHAALRP